MAAKKRRIPKAFLDIFSEIYRDAKKEVIARAKREILKQFIKARKRLKGEAVAVIGPPAAGKTTLLAVLREPDLTPDALAHYAKTEWNDSPQFVCSWKVAVTEAQQVKFRFKVRKSADVGGEKYIRENHWASVINDASVIIYVLDYPRLISDEGEYRQRIIEDFDWLLLSSQLPKPNFALVLAANKVDKLCDHPGFADFERSHAPRLEAIVNDVRARWKSGLHQNLKGAVLLSLTDPHLRQFTLDALILQLLGEDLRRLYHEAEEPS